MEATALAALVTRTFYDDREVRPREADAADEGVSAARAERTLVRRCRAVVATALLAIAVRCGTAARSLAVSEG